VPALIRLALRSSAQPEGLWSHGYRSPKSTSTRHGAYLFVFEFILVSAPTPSWLGRAAEEGPDQNLRCPTAAKRT